MFSALDAGVAFVGLFCLALIAGIGIEITLNNAVTRRLPAAAFVQLHQGRERVHARVMPVLANLALLATLGALYLLRGQGVRFVLVLASTLALLTLILVTLVVDLPINRRMHTWSSAEAPENWVAERDRWLRFNDIRTIASVVALATLLAGWVGVGVS
jgi:uncharacterized membrane protein